MWYTETLIISLVVSSLSFSIDYCSHFYDCGVRKQWYKHVMCYKQPKKDVCEYYDLEGSDSLRDTILELHNNVRHLMTTEKYARDHGLPKACQMNNMTWNIINQKFAARSTKSCLLNIDECRSQLTYKHVGQNRFSIEITGSSKLDVTQSFNTWLNTFYNAKDKAELVKSYKDGSWAEGSQILWETSTRIGCQQMGWRLPKDHNKHFQGIVCNYAPGGNVKGEQMYSTVGCNEVPMNESSISLEAHGGTSANTDGGHFTNSTTNNTAEGHSTNSITDFTEEHFTISTANVTEGYFTTNTENPTEGHFTDSTDNIIGNTETNRLESTSEKHKFEKMKMGAELPPPIIPVTVLDSIHIHISKPPSTEINYGDQKLQPHFTLILLTILVK